MKSGQVKIKDNWLKKVPHICGVYMFKKGKNVIYVGKSRDIHSRCIAHLNAVSISPKEKAIINNSDSFFYKQTISEFESLLLEAFLIKKYQPKYNSIIKDDKNPLYLKISIFNEYPLVSTVRKENDNRSIYFGPFHSASVCKQIIHTLRRVVPFCTQKKIGKHGCFYSRIGLCNPCPSIIENSLPKDKKKLKRLYLSNIKLLIKILTKSPTKVSKYLEKRMKRCVEKENFEQAIYFRNLLYSFTSLIANSFFSSSIEPQITNYKNLLSEWHSFLNFLSNSKNYINNFRIECIDISHTSFHYATGSLVVAEDGTIIPSQYRKFRILPPYNKSDTASIKNIIERRFKHTEWKFPALLLIDGGLPQVQTAVSSLENINIKIPVCGIAKLPDRIIYPRNTTYINIKKYPLLFKLFLILRDESHRFAKKYHLELMRKKILV